MLGKGDSTWRREPWEEGVPACRRGEGPSGDGEEGGAGSAGEEEGEEGDAGSGAVAEGWWARRGRQVVRRGWAPDRCSSRRCFLLPGSDSWVFAFNSSENDYKV